MNINLTQQKNEIVEKIGIIHTCGKLKAVLLSPIIAKDSRIWFTWYNKIGNFLVDRIRKAIITSKQLIYNHSK